MKIKCLTDKCANLVDLDTDFCDECEKNYRDQTKDNDEIRKAQEGQY